MVAGAELTTGFLRASRKELLSQGPRCYGDLNLRLESGDGETRPRFKGTCTWRGSRRLGLCARGRDERLAPTADGKRLGRSQDPKLEASSASRRWKNLPLWANWRAGRQGSSTD